MCGFSKDREEKVKKQTLFEKLNKFPPPPKILVIHLHLVAERVLITVYNLLYDVKNFNSVVKRKYKLFFYFEIFYIYIPFLSLSVPSVSFFKMF